MSIRVTVEKRDEGLKKVVARLRGMHGQRLLRVGLVGDKAKEPHKNANGLTVAQVGAIHEFGLAEPKIPQRSFVRAYVAREAPALQALARREGLLAMKGMRTQAQALAAVGKTMVEGMQSFITDGEVRPPLAESTIQKKGHETPLLETGQLRDAIAWVRDR